MTPTPTTAADLQALWTTPTPAIVTPADAGNAESIKAPAPITPPRCWHRDRSGWIDTPARTRPGWIRTTCSRCGGFVGYRPADTKTNKQKSRRLG